MRVVFMSVFAQLLLFVITSFFFAAQQTILLLNCKSLISIPFLQPCAIEMFTNKQLTFLLGVKRYQKQTQSRRKSFEKSKLK